MKGTEADVSVAIGGVKVRGFQIGRIALTTQLKGGKLNVNLNRLSLYGGNVTAKIALDGSGKALGINANVKVAKLNVGRLARVAAKGAPAIAGIANATLTAKASGANPRAIVEKLSAKLSLDLGGVNVKAAPISALSVDLDLPGLASPPKLKASVVYNRERVNIDVQVDPVQKILSGKRFAAKLDVASKLLRAGYSGAVLQKTGARPGRRIQSGYHIGR